MMSERPRVAILISGGGSNMVALVRDMQSDDHPAIPALVLSNRADAGGLQKATELGVATAVVDHRPHGSDRAAFEAEVQAVLEAHKIDLICLAGFMRRLTEAFTRAWAGRMINIHPSLLPLHKGLNTHARALEAGDTWHGCTVHEVTGELDDGPILGQARLVVRPGERAQDLAARVLQLEHRLYPAVLRHFAAGDRTMVNLE